jgi:hypothetical protein
MVRAGLFLASSPSGTRGSRVDPEQGGQVPFGDGLVQLPGGAGVGQPPPPAFHLGILGLKLGFQGAREHQDFLDLLGPAGSAVAGPVRRVECDEILERLGLREG